MLRHIDWYKQLLTVREGQCFRYEGHAYLALVNGATTLLRNSSNYLQSHMLKYTRKFEPSATRLTFQVT